MVSAERLDASRFGFDSSCFVCDDRNPRGLRVPFFCDADAGLVFADFDLPAEFSGAPTLVHGGVTLALVDEAMSWATIALSQRFAYTQKLEVEFQWSVRLGQPYRVEARIAAPGERRITTAATVTDSKGRPCVTASATMAVLDLGQASEATGTEVGDVDRKFVR